MPSVPGRYRQIRSSPRGARLPPARPCILLGSSRLPGLQAAGFIPLVGWGTAETGWASGCGDNRSAHPTLTLDSVCGNRCHLNVPEELGVPHTCFFSLYSLPLPHPAALVHRAPLAASPALACLYASLGMLVSSTAPSASVTLSRLTPLQHPCSCTPTSSPGCRQAGHPGVQNFPHLRCSSYVKPLTWRKSFVPPACNKAPQANDSQCNVILWVLFSFCLLFHLLICFLFCLVFFEGSGVGSS